MLQELTL